MARGAVWTCSLGWGILTLGPSSPHPLCSTEAVFGQAAALVLFFSGKEMPAQGTAQKEFYGSWRCPFSAAVLEAQGLSPAWSQEAWSFSGGRIRAALTSAFIAWHVVGDEY